MREGQAIDKSNRTGPGWCHFKPMRWECGDSDDTGVFDEWLECEVCGHTSDVPYEEIPDSA